MRVASLADNVPDGVDQCPDTPAGAGVDARGCRVTVQVVVRQGCGCRRPDRCVRQQVLLEVALDLEVLQTLGVLQRAVEAVVGLAPCLQRPADVVLGHEDGLHHQVGVELDLVQGMRVSGVRRADEQLGPALEERQDAVLREEVLADQPECPRRRVHCAGIEDRHTELDRMRGRQLRCAHELLFAQVLRNRLPLRGGRVERLAGHLFFQGAVKDEPTGDAGDADEVGGGAHE